MTTNNYKDENRKKQDVYWLHHIIKEELGNKKYNSLVLEGRLDKLEIKLEKVKDKISQEEIKKEYKILKEIQNSSIKLESKIKDLFRSIKEVNLNLWKVEDNLRICEKDKDFGGCRCQAFLLTGDMHKTDPVCDKSPDHHLTPILIG